ncbi:WD-40 repeat-containing protein [Vararia minispora EC-137]|uniref:WD-40 repeat-containing protein n=1 Tax=Vararia minispora EC-137 TaxID=1314806 RepID=A0ACB8QMV2_9AGAM|nr:WD-40 repeat-containing protein [Vararia minispora EC-137]
MEEPYDTVQPADSVEFCPHPAATAIFACGTYKLEDPDLQLGDKTPTLSTPEVETPPPLPKSHQKRTGRCLFFESSRPETPSLLQELALPAILDMKWCHTSETRQPLLAIADSECNISFHEWDIEEKRIDASVSVSLGDPQVLCLSLDWANRRQPTSSLADLVVSLSNGDLALLRQDATGGLSVRDSWHAHDYEPWIAAWNYWDTNIIYSGGDDLKMKAWDIRAGFSQPVAINKRFTAGVTTIQSHPNTEHIIAVGSYDSSVRLFDTRKLLTPLTQAEVGGGAWRVKWHPSPKRTHDLLVAAMHGGFKILKFHDMWTSQDTPPVFRERWTIMKEFNKHQSLAYGVDWSHVPMQDERGETLVASASFYDHAMYLWRG